jgi:nitric oxide reductase NorD protein
MDDSPPPPDAPELPPLALDPETDEREGGTPLSPEELKALLDAGVNLQIRQGKSDTITPQGLYISDLQGKLPQNGAHEQVAPDSGAVVVSGQRRREREEGVTFFYDEWDYQIADYRSRWCRLRELVLVGDAGEFFSKTLTDNAALTPAVKHEFQRIRPEQYRVIRGLEDGDDFDLNAVVTAASDLRARVSPSAKLYTTRRQIERDVAALFLLDMSASTDEPVVPIVRQYVDEAQDDWLTLWKKRPAIPSAKPRRIIDVTKEALVLMAEALEEIGDSYAIYGFSGQGRNNVEFYHVKSFVEVLSPTVKGRIGAIEPKRSTRMGAALRHALEKLKDVACRVKLLILLSDGFPQDMDYGSDRRSITYGIRDTMMALREADRAGVLTFCLTVDKAGHDYLREMCEPSRYLVLEDVASLPTELPKVYQRYIRPRGV